MGTRGPKAMPANVHMLRGNPSKKPVGDLLGELHPEVDIPKVPTHLWPEAKKEWKRIGVELQRYGLVSELDRAALALYCAAWARWVWAEGQLKKAMERAEADRLAAETEGKAWNGGDGFMMPTPNGSFTYSPYWVAANKAADQVDKFLASFGLSPSSRSRVSISNNRQGELFEAGEGDGGGSAWGDL